MKHLNLILATICCLALASCGKESKDSNDSNENVNVTLTPASTTIKGNLKEYFTVVDKSYTAKFEENGDFSRYIISIELERTDVPFKFDTEGVDPVGTVDEDVNGNFGIGIDIIDADGNIAISRSPKADGFYGVYDSDDLRDLFLLDSGETGRVRWIIREFTDYENKKFTFKVSSYLHMEKHSSGSSSSVNSDEDETSDKMSEDTSSSSHWDSVLDAYEKYVNEYIAVYKKVQAGDTNAFTKLASLTEKYQELGEQLENAEDEMTVSQMARLQKISAKLANAIQ